MSSPDTVSFGSYTLYHNPQKTGMRPKTAIYSLQIFVPKSGLALLIEQGWACNCDKDTAEISILAPNLKGEFKRSKNIMAQFGDAGALSCRTAEDVANTILPWLVRHRTHKNAWAARCVMKARGLPENSMIYIHG